MARLSAKITLLLAGGKSSRMKSLKGLLSYKGQPWMLEQIARLHQCGMTQVVVVLGYHAQTYLESLPLLTQENGFGPRPPVPVSTTISVVENRFPEYGLFSSIVAGLTDLMNHSAEAPVFILPIDVPCPTQIVWDSLSESLPLGRSSPQVAIPTFCGRGGHPVLLSPVFQEILLNIPLTSEEARLDFQLKRLPKKQIIRVETTDPQIQMNLNTPGEWKNYIDNYEHQIHFQSAERL